jgi:flagellar hook assembly protein FlgD
MKKNIYALLGSIFGQLFFVTVIMSQTTVNDWKAITGGGGISTTQGFNLTSIIGQPFVGKSSNNTTTVISGFLGYIYAGDDIISSNYPNPFSSNTTISWYLPSSGRVVLKLFDFLGREIKTLRDEEMASGEHEMQYKGENLPDGMYILRMETGNFSASEIMQKVK